MDESRPIQNHFESSRATNIRQYSSSSLQNNAVGILLLNLISVHRNQNFVVSETTSSKVLEWSCKQDEEDRNRTSFAFYSYNTRIRIPYLTRARA